MVYLVDYYVLRLDIAVKNAMRVEFVDCLADLLDDCGDFGFRHGF